MGWGWQRISSLLSGKRGPAGEREPKQLSKTHPLATCHLPLMNELQCTQKVRRHSHTRILQTSAKRGVKPVKYAFFFFFPPFCFYFLFLLLGSLPLCSMPEWVRAMSTGLWQGWAETRTSQGGKEGRRQAELFERTLCFS